MSKLVSIVFLFTIVRSLFAAPVRDQPNFIFVITDDQRWDAMGVVQREQGAKAIDWLADNKTKPFSMVIGYKSPHNHRGGENLPPRLRSLYEGETSRPVPSITSPAVFHQHIPKAERQPHRFVQNELQLDYLRHVKGVDENLGRLLDALDDYDLTGNTVVVFTTLPQMQRCAIRSGRSLKHKCRCSAFPCRGNRTITTTHPTTIH